MRIYLDTDLLGVICDRQNGRVEFAVVGLGVQSPLGLEHVALCLGLCLAVLLGGILDFFGLGLFSLGVLGRLRNLGLSGLDIDGLVCHFCRVDCSRVKGRGSEYSGLKQSRLA